ncbi:MAG: protease inhibitor I42 family protein [Armatimonadetes bacterium]|nr:protease inhibitor I42 family protein [Armatimonadota bacterium]
MYTPSIAATSIQPYGAKSKDSYPLTLSMNGAQPKVLSGGSGAWIVQMAPGSKFSASLPENPGSTGMYWRARIEPYIESDEGYVQLKKDEYQPSQAILPGSGGIHRFEFSSGDNQPANLVKVIFELNVPFPETTKPAAVRRLAIQFVPGSTGQIWSNGPVFPFGK